MVREVEISKLKEAPYNPKIDITPDSAEWRKLQRSIEEFGFVEPLIWNERTGNVVDGNQRLTFLKSLGWKTVPCSVVNLDEVDEKVLNVALQKIKGKWDYEKLADVLKDFDYQTATASGFAEEEIAIILSNNSDLISDEDFGSWDDFDEEDSEEQIVGGSFVVTLVFLNEDLAKEWAEQEGYKGKVKEGKTTTVIRIDE